MVIIACVILAILIAIILIFLFAKNAVRCDSSCLIGILGVPIGSIFLAVLIYMAFNKANPSIQPIDVYQGKTTLEIIYRDSVVVDSIVIWKEE